MIKIFSRFYSSSLLGGNSFLELVSLKPQQQVGMKRFQLELSTSLLQMAMVRIMDTLKNMMRKLPLYGTSVNQMTIPLLPALP